MGQAVGANHRVRVGQDRLHILLIHREVDGARRLKLPGRSDLIQVHLGGDGGQLTSRELRPRMRPGDQNAIDKADHVLPQDRGGRVVGVDVEGKVVVTVLLLLGEERQGFLGPPEIVLTDHLMVGHDDRSMGLAADAEGLLQRVHHAIGLVPHVGDIAGAVPSSTRPISMISSVGAFAAGLYQSPVDIPTAPAPSPSSRRSRMAAISPLSAGRSSVSITPARRVE